MNQLVWDKDYMASGKYYIAVLKTDIEFSNTINLYLVKFYHILYIKND